MTRAPWLALALALALPGCALLQGEGDEKLTLRNQDSQPLTVTLVLTQDAGGVRIFGENVFLERGQAREYELTMRPGGHSAFITTSTSVQETLYVEIPKKGDTHIEVIVVRGGATLRVTSG